MISTCTENGRANRHDLSHRVMLTFKRSSYPALANLSVVENAGVVVITGSLPSYYLKQIAQTIAGSVDGVRALDNQAVVTR